jgi:KRAB domain-containing zinc finger protein
MVSTVSLYFSGNSEDSKTANDKKFHPLKCEHWTSVFPSMVAMQIHLNTYTSGKTAVYSCIYCDRTFDRQKILRQHTRIQGGKTECIVRNEMINMKSGQCKLCKRTYQNQFVLSQHMNIFHDSHRSHTYKKVYTCVVCQLKTADITEYHNHIAAYLANQGAFPCSNCKKTFPTYNSIQDHVLCCQSIKLYQCHHCILQYPLKYKLKTHLFRKHFKSKQHKFKCLQCPKFYTVRAYLRDHMLYHAGLKYECAECSATFPNKPKLLKHLNLHKLSDSQRKRLQLETCILCGKIVRSYAMTRHILKHSNYSRQQCNLCGAVLYSSVLLEQHMNKEHRKNLNCPICNRKFYIAYTLNVHVKKFHDIDHLLFCEYCETCFATETAKEVHMRSQHGTTEIVRNEQHYGCHHCRSRFTTKAAIERHLLTKHYKNDGTAKNKMVYDCFESNCDKKFSKHQYLDGHMIVHSGKKHFQCDYCALAFTRKPKLLKHFAVRQQNGQCTF